MITCIILSIILVILYVGMAIIIKKELPDSISAMVYVLPEGGWQWLWTVWLWIVSFLTLLPIITELSKIGMGALGFGALVCLIFCGAMPLFNKENEDLHWIFGTSGCVLTQACVYFINYECLWIWMFFPFFFLSKYIQPDGWLGKLVKEKWVLIAEAICYICPIYALLTRYICSFP